jgi:hypothetical protein
MAYLREYVDRWQQLYAKKEKNEEDVVALYALLDQEMAVIAKQDAPANQKKVAYQVCALVLVTFQRGMLAADNSFKSLFGHVESALSYQRRLIAFQDANEQDSISLFIRWQSRLLAQILLLPELKKHKEAKEVIVQAKEVLASSPEALLSGEVLLEKAMQLLREQKEQSEESKQQSRQEAHQMQMEKKTLQLSPEMSIRLLQEMYRDDMSLEESQSKASEGKRPW